MTYINDDCIDALRETLISLTNLEFRKCVTEVTVLNFTINALKHSRPDLAQMIEQTLEFSRHNEDIKKAVETRVGDRLKFLRSLDRTNFDQVVQSLLKQQHEREIPN